MKILGLFENTQLVCSVEAPTIVAPYLNEFESLRRANILFFEALPEEAWSNGGIASGNYVSVRALAFIIAGHEIHHRNVIEERYLSASSATA